MDENITLQKEEAEVLLSIYDGDENFIVKDESTYQYKFGEAGSNQDFVVELHWSAEYPAVVPKVSLDAFYNSHIVQDVKDMIRAAVIEEAEKWVGSAMTFTLFEAIKERYTELVCNQPDSASVAANLKKMSCGMATVDESVVQKKERLTKSQKRKQLNRLDQGELPRGYDWIDVIRHLSQCGTKVD